MMGLQDISGLEMSALELGLVSGPVVSQLLSSSASHSFTDPSVVLVLLESSFFFTDSSVDDKLAASAFLFLSLTDDDPLQIAFLGLQDCGAWDLVLMKSLQNT